MLDKLSHFFLRRRNWTLPYALFLLIFAIVPLLLIVLYAFTDADGAFTFAIAELLTMNNIKLFGTTVQENIYNGMWNYGAALSLIMLLLIGVTILFTNEEDGASNESGGVI